MHPPPDNPGIWSEKKDEGSHLPIKREEGYEVNQENLGYKNIKPNHAAPVNPGYASPIITRDTSINVLRYGSVRCYVKNWDWGSTQRDPPAETAFGRKHTYSSTSVEAKPKEMDRRFPVI